jgi:hypothetical protein
MTSLYTVSRDDLYDFVRCPKIVSYKAFRTIQTILHPPPPKVSPSVREIEPAIVGKIGERAVEIALGEREKPVTTAAMVQELVRTVPEADLNEHLKAIAYESLRGMATIRNRLMEEYGQITILGKGSGRHPDLSGRVQPDYIAFAAKRKAPIIVEVKDTRKLEPQHNFQATYYNGIAAKYGVYSLESRLEGKRLVVSPRLVQGAAETILIYPRLSEYKVVRELFSPGLLAIKQIWKAKELGMNGQVPETNCREGCPHLRYERKLNKRLPEDDMEPLAPLPLIYANGMEENNYDLSAQYQLNYARKLIPFEQRHAALTGHVPAARLDEWKTWLATVVGLDPEIAEIVFDEEKQRSYFNSLPNHKILQRYIANDASPWRKLLRKSYKDGLATAGGLASSIYSLPAGSDRFVKNAKRRWR